MIFVGPGMHHLDEPSCEVRLIDVVQFLVQGDFDFVDEVFGVQVHSFFDAENVRENGGSVTQVMG